MSANIQMGFNSGFKGLRDEHRLRLFNNVVLKGIFEHQMELVRGR